jgi:hypothetical protein
MKKILFAMAMLACSLMPAHADPLPQAYIGLWCFEGENWDDIDALPIEFDGYVNGQLVVRNGTCFDNEVYIKVTPKGYDLNEDDRCDFVSIKHTGKFEEIPLSKTKYYKIPYIRTVAKCGGEGTSWIEKREFTYRRGGVFTSKLLYYSKPKIDK